MKRTVVVASALLALGLSSTAAGYQNEGRIRLRTRDVDGTNVDISLWDFGYRYYFAEVDDDDVPYWLQPFKQRASWAEAAYITGTWDPGSNDIGGIHIAGRYVIPEQPVGVDVEYVSVDVNDNAWESRTLIGAVYWLNDDSDLAVEASLAFGDQDMIPDESTEIRVGVRSILPVGDYLLEVAGRFASLNYDNSDDESGLEVETRFFLEKRIFAGFSFSTVDDGQDESTWELSGGYSDETGIRAELGLGKDEDDSVFRLEVGYRF